MKYRKGYYRKDGTYVQGHFFSGGSKKRYKNNGCLLVFIPLLVLFITVGSCSEETGNNNCPTKTCSDFTTQSEAQSAYNSDTECYKNLDADKDGIACENLPN